MFNPHSASSILNLFLASTLPVLSPLGNHLSQFTSLSFRWHKFENWVTKCSFYSDFCLPTHGRCRGLLFHLITHTHTRTRRNSVGYPWTRERPVLSPFTCTTHNNHNRKKHQFPPGGIRHRNPSKRATTGLHLIPRSYGIGNYQFSAHKN